MIPKTHKLLLVARLSARQRLAERGPLLARAGFYALVLFVFSRLWAAIVGDHGDIAGDTSQFVWYLAITEWIVLSQVPVHLDVEREIRQGDLAYRLARPVSYVAFMLAQAWGDLLARMAVMAPIGFVAAWLLTGQLPVPAPALLGLLVIGPLAGMLGTACILGVGLTALSLHDCRPVYWIWQKATYTLGGLFVPLSLYPAWLRRFAEHTPFAAILDGPGSIALGRLPAEAVLSLAATQLGWLLVAITLLALAMRRIVTRLNLEGG